MEINTQDTSSSIFREAFLDIRTRVQIGDKASKIRIKLDKDFIREFGVPQLPVELHPIWFIRLFRHEMKKAIVNTGIIADRDFMGYYHHEKKITEWWSGSSKNLVVLVGDRIITRGVVKVGWKDLTKIMDSTP
jgi:hypothetical protein